MKRVQTFRKDKDIRVFIFTRVGATGINLTEADTIIYAVRVTVKFRYCILTPFKDQAWSGQEMKQARGRCHRQPQKKVVHCYHLLAENTADILLYGLARGKEEMMTAFLSKEEGRGKTLHNF